MLINLSITDWNAATSDQRNSIPGISRIAMYNDFITEGYSTGIYIEAFVSYVC